MRFLDTDAACARVFVTNSRGLNRVSTPVLRSTSRDRIVGIAQDEYTGERIQIQAKGYRAADCSGDPIDFSKVEERVFASGEVKADVLLVLKGGMTADAGGGAGGGGGTAGGGAGGGGGGPDAGGGAGGGGGSGGGGNLPDGGTAELCGNTVDDDGDGLIDCFDPECLLQDCNFGRRCTSIGVCMVPPKEMVCNDGLDDDNDTEVDCADPDCNNKSCADALTCTYGETCQAKVCTPAKTITCATPGECQMGAGTCLADAGCGYASKANATPCDGGACQAGECVLGFPYAPSNGAVANQPASAIAPRIRLDCGVSTFNSDTLAFGNWCSQTQPAPQLVNRLGVQNLIVLPMAGLEVIDELRITGGNPVILLVFGDAQISGRLDVSGRGPLSGGGGPASNCLLQGDPLTPPLIYAGGGGGGAGFAQPGSKGGNSNGNLFSGGPAGGTYLVAPNVILRGGCAGSDGASGVMGQQAALGGGAGGAVQVSVSGTLVVEGRVMANGGGGQGGVTFNAGGGGGASGGGIVLEANVLDVRATALITAHGGGGGGGARDNDDGANGQDGHSADNNVAQGGAKGGGQAGDGANGGATGGPGSAGDGSTSAGGGGGGGVGKIHLRSIQTCLTAGGRLVSPVPSGNCP